MQTRGWLGHASCHVCYSGSNVRAAGGGEQPAGGVLVKVETTPLINPAPAQPSPYHYHNTDANYARTSASNKTADTGTSQQTVQLLWEAAMIVRL